MPYLQLDLPNQYAAETKRRVARRLGDLYCKMMQARPGIVSVGFRELGPHNLWKAGDIEPRPGAVIQCDIRRGRTAEQREAVARAIVALCEEELSIPAADIVLEFTQHAADEWFVSDKLATEWQPAEGSATAARRA
jgi:phenylpyruvate tautomerase PptA (4-oxalocrotonate tautomerase family)